MEGIEIIGSGLLSQNEKETAERLFQESYEKIERKIKNKIKLKLDIKTRDKNSKQKQYIIHMKLITSTRVLEAHAEEWEFTKAIHEVINKMLEEIEHSFHSSEQK